MTEKRSEVKLPLLPSKNHRYSSKMIKSCTYLPPESPMKIVRAHGTAILHSTEDPVVFPWLLNGNGNPSIIFVFGSEMSQSNFNRRDWIHAC